MCVVRERERDQFDFGSWSHATIGALEPSTVRMVSASVSSSVWTSFDISVPVACSISESGMVVRAALRNATALEAYTRRCDAEVLVVRRVAMSCHALAWLTRARMDEMVDCLVDGWSTAWLTSWSTAWLTG